MGGAAALAQWSAFVDAGGMRTAAIVGCLVLGAGCSDRVAMTEPGATSTGEASTSEGASGSGTGVVPTSGAPTSEGSSGGTESSGSPVSASSDGSESSSGGSSSGGSEGSSESGSEGGSESTDGPVSGCASACDRTSTHDGNILIEPGDATDWLKCVTRVTGDVLINGDVDAAGLAGLADLRQVDGDFAILSNAVLTDLSPVACLRTVNGWLRLSFMPLLTNLAGLEGLEFVRQLQLRATAVANVDEPLALKGVAKIDLFDNPELEELGAVEGWEIASDEIVLQMGNNPKLKDLLGFAGLLAQAGPEVEVAVQVFDSPGMTSLKGLEAMTHGHLVLSGLVKVADLEPLANLTTAGSVTMSDMPLLTSLHGLHNLKSVGGTFSLGACTNGGPDSPGMDGLKDLQGLDSLTQVSAFGLANNKAMTGLGGAPKLTTVQWFEAVGNSMLKQPAVDAFLAQLDMAPDLQCFGGWNQCECFQVLPW